MQTVATKPTRQVLAESNVISAAFGSVDCPSVDFLCNSGCECVQDEITVFACDLSDRRDHSMFPFSESDEFDDDECQRDACNEAACERDHR